MKFHFVALTLAAALAAPVIAQQPDKPSEESKAEEKAPAPKTHSVEREKGSVKAQEANQEKVDTRHDKNDAREHKLPQSDQEPGVRNPEAKTNDQEPAKRGPGGDREGKKEVSERDRSVHYQFKGEAREKLREHYKSVSTNHTRTVTVVRQEVLPVEVQTRIEPVPVEMVTYLGPAPEGFQYGYVDGYVLVYDPMTFFVVDVIDLF